MSRTIEAIMRHTAPPSNGGTNHGLSRVHTTETIVTNRRKENMNERLPNETNDKPRILIVDNNSRFARSAQLFLEHTGNYFACTVIDPRRALETARSFKPDLVVADLIMPHADALALPTPPQPNWALHE